MLSLHLAVAVFRMMEVSVWFDFACQRCPWRGQRCEQSNSEYEEDIESGSGYKERIRHCSKKYESAIQNNHTQRK
ncbi:hypothetical protein TSUD_145840 [Trifolium subterraneum]|uniref:Uncharacterized protein n=1 Tax=Trifolium subterraneum TaxID=3900 RepID=A0A2Z6P3I8_TRISU|nr:hypothetical protein TSUD_145840 [Trifolium subterraneum]